MKQFKLWAIVAAVVIFAVSCGDDDSEDMQTNTDLLTGKNWVFTSILAGAVDLQSFLDTCERDDAIMFNVDGTITNDAGTMKCDPAEPQTSSGGTWSFNADETVLTTVDGSDVMDINIISLTETSLSGTFQDTIFGSVTAITVTLSCQ